MTAYVREYRWMPLLGMGLLGIVYLLGLIAWVRADWIDRVVTAPLAAIASYGLAVGSANRTRVLVNGEGARIWMGPIPVQPQPHAVKREEVAKVYVRHALLATKSGPKPYLVAGVERKDGRWVDLSGPLHTDAEVWRHAESIARALQWAGPIDELSGNPPATDPLDVWPSLCWGASVMGALAWVAAAEFLLR